MTNPIWVVKVRMFTTRADSPTSYRNLWGELKIVLNHFTQRLMVVFSDGLKTISRTEGLAGLWRGSTLALFGVSNGAIQFMAYEEMKRWGFERKKRQFEKVGRVMTPGDDKLVSNFETWCA